MYLCNYKAVHRLQKVPRHSNSDYIKSILSNIKSPKEY